jgi:hypothetical protein
MEGPWNPGTWPAGVGGSLESEAVIENGGGRRVVSEGSTGQEITLTMGGHDQRGGCAPPLSVLAGSRNHPAFVG